jgi:hypothetical protein
MKKRLLVLLCTIPCFFATFVGCSQSTAEKLVAEANKSNIQRLANLYGAYMAQNGWKGPKDEATFKAFIGKADATMLKNMSVDAGNTDGLFKSEKDGKPFKIRYGVQGGLGAIVPVIFEDGTGQRQVAFTGMKLETVDDATYEQLWKGIVPQQNAGSGGNQNQAPIQGGPPPGVMNRPSGAGGPSGKN